ncbi:MAG: hypothetical protein KAY37_13070 [Phycisphaerae bacterium]|nr:hypothetical protein [Phycisphaerae bacterium]
MQVQALRMGFRGRNVVLAVILLAAVGFASADTWLEVDASGTAVLRPVQGPAATLYTNAEIPGLSVDRSDWAGLSVTAWTPGLLLRLHENEVGQFVEATWPEAAVSGEIGTPAMPVLRGLLVVPAGADVNFTYELGPATTIDLAANGLPSWLLSVQPPIEKVPGALESAAFAFEEAAYALDEEQPGEWVVVEELGEVRGQRLCLLEIRPVAHNPVAGTLTLCPEIAVDIKFEGGFLPRDAHAPLPGLGGIVLNPEILPPMPTRAEEGDYLIIAASAYETAIQPFAAAKANQGYTVSTWVPPSASASVIKSHIQSLWGAGQGPDYILLVGDTDTIPAWTGGGSGSPDTDLPYTCMGGPGDWYPDIAIGRFPVRNASQLQAMVDKTLVYEISPLPDIDYLNRAVFMASNDNYTVSEGTHNWVISNYMTPHGVTSDKLYCHTYNATTQQVRDAFNAGRFWGVYSGHGGPVSWADGPPFSQSDVNNLMNADMYPVVFSFACVTGSYVMNECFTETWIRAEDKGAIAIYGSSVNSYWTEDDVLEKRLFDSIYDDGDDVPAQVGPVWNDTLYRYLLQMGSHSTTRRYFEMYNLMGDPSLPYFRADIPVYGLGVTPGDELEAEGPAGGPFTPNSIVYMLENLGDEPIEYEVAKTAEWLTITNPSGTLPGLGTTTVTVSINSEADSLNDGRYEDTLAFNNLTSYVGFTTRAVVLRVGSPQLIHEWSFESDPGWVIQGQWAWGQPAGNGGQQGGPDPTSGYTGENVYGYNLNGDYANNLTETHLTSAVFDCTGFSDVQLKYRRWLGVEHPYSDHAYVRVSDDGLNWVTIWGNSDEIAETAWTLQEFDISSIADDQERVYLRWTMGVTDSDGRYCGWNIDDVEIWALPAVEPVGACCHSDGSCTMETQAECSGSWLGTWTDCSANPCPPPSGACCLADGSCIVNPEADCRGIWLGAGTSCNPNPCPQPTGACCDYYGRCELETEDECLTEGGSYQGDDTPCTPNPCPPPAVCRGDSNCDLTVDWQDIDYFVAAMNDNVSAWEGLFAPDTPACSFANNDVNEDGTVSWRDIDQLVAIMNTTCD